MNINIQTVKFNADEKLISFIRNKMAKLQRFATDAISSEVVLKEDKNDQRGDKVATIKLRMPGDELVADFRSTSYEEAVDEGIEALKKQLERHKERFNKRS